MSYLLDTIICSLSQAQLEAILETTEQNYFYHCQESRKIRLETPTDEEWTALLKREHRETQRLLSALMFLRRELYRRMI